MASVTLSPVFNGWQGLGSSLVLLNGGLLNTYLAGSTTPAATYTTIAGSIQNTNPIVLNSDGRPPQEIWLDTTKAYKFVLTDSLANVLGTYDNIYPVPTVAALQSGAYTLLGSVAGTNTITATGSPTLSAYASGQTFILVPANTTTGAATLNIDGLGAKNIFSGGAALVVGELRQNVPVSVEYDGTQLNILGGSLRGTFTPGITFGGGNTGITYNTRVGLYRLSGGECKYSLRIILSSKGSSTGIMSVTGLPFTSNASLHQATGSIPFQSISSGITQTLSGYVAAGTTAITVVYGGSGGSTTMDDTVMNNTSDLIISGSYLL